MRDPLLHPMCPVRALAPARLPSLRCLLSADPAPWQVLGAGTEGGRAA